MFQARPWIRNGLDLHFKLNLKKIQQVTTSLTRLFLVLSQLKVNEMASDKK